MFNKCWFKERNSALNIYFARAHDPQEHRLCQRIYLKKLKKNSVCTHDRDTSMQFCDCLWDTQLTRCAFSFWLLLSVFFMEFSSFYCIINVSFFCNSSLQPFLVSPYSLLPSPYSYHLRLWGEWWFPHRRFLISCSPHSVDLLVLPTVFIFLDALTVKQMLHLRMALKV